MAIFVSYLADLSTDQQRLISASPTACVPWPFLILQIL